VNRAVLAAIFVVKVGLFFFLPACRHEQWTRCESRA
jgi:hypothetical protein